MKTGNIRPTARHKIKAVCFLLVFISTFLLILTDSKLVSAQSCSKQRPTSTVKSSLKPTKIKRTQSSNDLTQLHGANKAGVQVMGLGGGDVGVEIKATFKILGQDGQNCVSITDVKLLFFARPEINIANNFQRGSCEYSEVLLHEQKHVNTLRQFHREYTPRLNKELKRILASIPNSQSAESSEISKTQSWLLNNIKNATNQYLQEIFPELQNRQNAIDTMQEYQRVASKCKKWEEKLNSK